MADDADDDALCASLKACTLTQSVEALEQLARTESARVREHTERLREEARVHDRQCWEDDRELRATRAEMVWVRSAVSGKGVVEPLPLGLNDLEELEVVLRICTFLRPKDLRRLRLGVYRTAAHAPGAHLGRRDAFSSSNVSVTTARSRACHWRSAVVQPCPACHLRALARCDPSGAPRSTMRCVAYADWCHPPERHRRCHGTRCPESSASF